MKRETKNSIIFVLSLMVANSACAATAQTDIVTGHKPTATIDLDSKTPTLGQKITATLHFQDQDGDAEDPVATNSTWTWYTSTTSKGIPANQVMGATSDNYTPVAADVGKYLWAEATPESDSTITEPFAGEQAASDLQLVQAAGNP